MTQQTQENDEITPEQWDAFVTQEAIKMAAAEGVDVGQMSADDFATLKVGAQELIEADPEAYFASLEAAEAEEAVEEEMRSKIAESEYLGARMALSFARTLGIEVPEGDEGEKLAGMGQKFEQFAARVGKGVHDKTGLGKKGVEAAKATGSANHAKNISKGVNPETAHRAHQHGLNKHYAGLGKKVLGGAAAATGVAGGAAAAAAHNRSKKSAEEIQAEGLAVARAFLVEQGIDPDTGVKVAGIDAEIDPEVLAYAQALLEQRGYVA